MQCLSANLVNFFVVLEQIVNPVYDAEASIELYETSNGANNNVLSTDKDIPGSTGAAGDFSVELENESGSPSSLSNGEVMNGIASTSAASTESTWHNKANEVSRIFIPTSSHYLITVSTLLLKARLIQRLGNVLRFSSCLEIV